MFGLESDDIDIALDDMCGEEFAQKLTTKMVENGKKLGLSKEELAKFHFGVVKANSEKSKHLETATLMVDGMSIDFVNLRSETYTEGSRVPTM